MECEQLKEKEKRRTALQELPSGDQWGAAEGLGGTLKKNQLNISMCSNESGRTISEGRGQEVEITDQENVDSKGFDESFEEVPGFENEDLFRNEYEEDGPDSESANEYPAKSNSLGASERNKIFSSDDENAPENNMEVDNVHGIQSLKLGEYSNAEMGFPSEGGSYSQSLEI